MAFPLMGRLALWGAVIIAIVLALRADTVSGGNGAGREDILLDNIKRH